MTIYGMLLFMILGAYFAGLAGYVTARKANRADVPAPRTAMLFGGIGMVSCGTVALSGSILAATLLTGAWALLSLWASRGTRRG